MRSSQGYTRGLGLALLAMLSLAQSVAAQRDQKVLERAEKSYKVVRQTDEFTKASAADLLIARYYGDEQRVQCTNTRRYTTNFALTLRKYLTGTGESRSAIHVLYTGREWLFIEAEAGLLVKVRDSLITLPPAGESDQKVDRGVREGAWFLVAREELLTIGSADSAKVRVTGRAGRCDILLVPETLELMRMFALRELSDSTAVSP